MAYDDDNSYDESYLIQAEREVKKLRDAALKKVQREHPEIRFAVDPRPIDEYCYKTWDYPGKWYYAGFRMPAGFHSKEELIEDIARNTIRYFSREERNK